MTDKPSGPELAAELEDLRARLAEAEEVLRAIRNGEMDAVLVAGERGAQVYTLSGADRIYRQLIETMSEGAVTLSADGVILYCNVRLAEMLGQPLDRVLGTALRNYLPPTDQQAVDAILAQAHIAPSRREINLKTSEGRLVPVYLSASVLQREGTERVFCLVLTDLTEQKSLEHIVAAERLARLVLEQAAEAIVVCDEQGRVIRVSQAAQQFCDGSPLLRPFDEVFPLRTGVPDPFHLASVLQGETLRNLDVVLDRRGQKLDLLLNAGPLLSGQQILGCVVTLTDITERKRAEMELLEAKALVETVVEHIPLMIFLKEATDLRFVIFNRAGVELLGYDRKALIGKNNLDLFPPEQAAHFMAKDREALAGHGVVDIPEEFIQTAKKGLRVLHTRKVRIMGGDGITKYLLGISEDITESKKAEARLQETLLGLRNALGEIIQVLAAVSEIRDPYTAGHQRRVANLAQAIAQELGLSPDRAEGIRVAGLIHDIGKMSIPAEILSKPARLSKIEYALIQAHAQIGHDILGDVKFAWPIANIILRHHERMDGSGYPQRLKGDDILLESRILAVSDVIEAMASHRPYRSALGIEAALKEIENGKGVLYDPAVVSACLTLFREKGYALKE
jgi:PAS domain S-box-containing protein/putative nucleotidyltransferase with HDIG domain